MKEKTYMYLEPDTQNARITMGPGIPKMSQDENNLALAIVLKKFTKLIQKNITKAFIRTFPKVFRSLYQMTIK